jgi:hypothetical protein
MFDVFYSGDKPELFEFEQLANSLEHAAELSKTRYYWYIYGSNDCTDFDFDYVPPPWESEHVHVWPDQWRNYGGIYLINKHTIKDYKWQFHDTVVHALPTTNHWKVLHNIESDKFDWSWRPHPMDPPFIYVFGNQWYSPERMPTVEYHVQGATERKYIYDLQATLPVNKTHWKIDSDVPFDFDFSWIPDPHDPPFIYVFGNQHWSGERSATLEYHVPGATERKFIGDVLAKLSTLDIFFVDRSNPTAEPRFERLKMRYPHAQKVRYANSMFDTVKRCSSRSNTNRFWVVSSEYDYTDFNFDWQPEPWQQSMTHVFPTKWQKWSDTFLFNKWGFEKHSEWANSIEQFPNLNFVINQTVNKPDNLHNIYYIDYGNTESKEQLNLLKERHCDIVVTRFFNSYLDTFKRIVLNAETEYVWIINSICNYVNFDFTWQPEPWQKEMVHCFASNNQPRGDTFYIHVESFKKQMVELELLDWFNVINYCEDQTVERYMPPVHIYSSDNLSEEIKHYEFKHPYVLFTNQTTLSVINHNCMWSPKDRVVERLTASGATALVPRDIKVDLRTQIYDYPYLSTSKVRLNDYFSDEYNQLDIVYISNGEPDEQKWYEHACYMSNSEVKWIRGVNGRTAAYQAAARASRTPWFFAVFAKLEVLGSSFDWHWMPDMWQEPKHYIFNARNPVNGLEYGHMGMIAYNKKLVLENNNSGIDFTLSQPHESVPILSGIAHYNQDPWTTWRTAFREVLKLRLFMDTQPTLETEYRLKAWFKHNDAVFGEWSVRGAQDAQTYYDLVGGEYNQLMKSFEWDWLREHFNRLHSIQQ